MYYIDKNKKPQSLKLFLTKPNRVTIGTLKHVHSRKLTVNFGQINELTFTIPYMITLKNKLVRNPLVDKVKEKYFIRSVFGTNTEWFIITKINKSSNDSDDLNIECKSLGYQLFHRKIIDYTASSYNCLQVLTDCLKGTGWNIGYINPDFNLKYRQFDVSSQTRLDFVYDIATTFEGVVAFDTVNKKVSIYKEEELSQYKGFIITYGKYLTNIEENIDSDEIVTRLHVKGSDNLTFNEVNATGLSYIDDFSYFLYPFSIDENGKVISSSYFMEDDLAITLTKYNAYVSSRKGEFADLLDQKKKKQESLTTEQNKLTELNNELQQILDDIEIAKVSNSPTDDLITQQNAKNKEIDAEKAIIATIESDIKNIDSDTDTLKNDVKMENHLTPEQMDELNNFIHEEEWSDENQIDVNDLYESALKHLSEINSPPINITAGIVNFFEMITEQRNWDRLSIGDIIQIQHDKLNILVKTKVSQMVFDFESANINITISNTKKLENDLDKIKRAFYTISKINTDYNSRKINWKTAVNNFNYRNDRISEVPEKPTVVETGLTHVENDNGSVNVTVSWSYPNFSETKKNEHNIDGFLIYLHPDKVNIPYTFGSQMASETFADVVSTTNSYTFPAVPANLFYTIGIKAYRRVDDDINADGILMSDIIVFNKDNKPYQPTDKITLNGEFTGKLNGITYTVDKNAPLTPSNNDKWTDVSGANPVEKIYDEKTNTWKIPSSSTVNLGTPDGVASLDSTGNVPSSQLNNAFKFKMGSYIGDGTLSKFINVGFTPNLIKVFSTNNADSSLYINSANGGYVLTSTGNSVALIGDGTAQPSAANGKLVTNGFNTGNSVDLYGNKLDIMYYYETYYIPS